MSKEERRGGKSNMLSGQVIRRSEAMLVGRRSLFFSFFLCGSVDTSRKKKKNFFSGKKKGGTRQLSLNEVFQTKEKTSGKENPPSKKE